MFREPALAVAAAEDAGSNEMHVQVSKGLLSVEVGAVPFHEVLHTIGEQAEVRVVVRGDSGKVRAQVFEGIPLADGIQRLAAGGNMSLAMIYALDQAGTRRLAEVRAYEASKVTGLAPANPGTRPAAQ